MSATQRQPYLTDLLFVTYMTIRCAYPRRSPAECMRDARCVAGMGGDGIYSSLLMGYRKPWRRTVCPLP